MAFQNLLQASFTGKVGAFVGRKSKNKNLIQSRKKTASHPTSNQSEAFQSFACLRRVSAVIAANNKKAFTKIKPYHSLANLLTALFCGYRFQNQIVPAVTISKPEQNPLLLMLEASADMGAATATIKIIGNKNGDVWANYHAQLFVFSADGFLLAVKKSNVTIGSVVLPLATTANKPSFATLVLSGNTADKQQRLHVQTVPVSLVDLPIVENGVLYTSRLGWQQVPTTADGCLYMGNLHATVSNGVLSIVSQ